MIRPYQKGGDGLRAEDGETGVLKVKENVAEFMTRGAVTISDDRLDIQLGNNTRIYFVEIKLRQHRVRRGTATEIVLHEQHVGDSADIAGVTLFQIGRVIGRTKRKASQLNRVVVLTNGKTAMARAGTSSGRNVIHVLPAGGFAVSTFFYRVGIPACAVFYCRVEAPASFSYGRATRHKADNPTWPYNGRPVEVSFTCQFGSNAESYGRYEALFSSLELKRGVQG